MLYKITGKHVAEPTADSLIREQLYLTYPYLHAPKIGRHS